MNTLLIIVLCVAIACGWLAAYLQRAGSNLPTPLGDSMLMALMVVWMFSALSFLAFSVTDTFILRK